MLIRAAVTAFAFLGAHTALAQPSESTSPLHWGKPKSGSPESPNAEPTPDLRGTKQVPLAVEVIRTEADKERERSERNRAEDKAAEEHELVKATWWLVIITGALAVFTALLYWSTRRIAIDARDTGAAALAASSEATNLARAEFNATHRPEIIVHTCESTTDSHATGDGLGAQITIVNKGTSPAIVEKIEGKLFYAQELRPGTLLDDLGVTAKPLVAGGQFDMAILGEPGSAILPYLPVRPGDAAFWCIGRITYTDTDRRKRQTGFCRSLDRKTMRWVREPNSDYEYAY